MYTRILYAAAIIICILLGLSSRRFSELLPPFISDHAGDMLWAMMVYFGFRFIGIKKSLLWAAVYSVLFSFAIEFSQIYQAEWINKLRNTGMGALILGRGFLEIDLLRYVAGITIAFSVDKYGLQLQRYRR